MPALDAAHGWGVGGALLGARPPPPVPHPVPHRPVQQPHPGLALGLEVDGAEVVLIWDSSSDICCLMGLNHKFRSGALIYHWLTPSQPFLSLDLHCRDIVLVWASGNVTCCEVILQNHVIKADSIPLKLRAKQSMPKQSKL